MSDRPGILRLFLANNPGDHRTYDSKDNRNYIEVNATDLDSYLPDINVNFIKMDIQGAEHMALKGMKKLINRSDSVKIITEFWPFGLCLAGSGPDEYLAALIDAGFELRLIDGTARKVQSIAIEDLARMYDASKDEWSSDLLCQKYCRQLGV